MFSSVILLLRQRSSVGTCRPQVPIRIVAMRRSSLLILIFLQGIIGAIPTRGPYPTSHTTLTLSNQDSSDQNVDVYYPSNASSALRFPLISYAHGDGGGGAIDWLAYIPLLSSLASHGYVVASTRACNTGCRDGCATLPNDPSCFGNFYKNQLGVIDASNISFADYSRVGIAGHSMGGQATLFSSSYTNASSHGIKAAVMHHAYTHQSPSPQVPFLAFTGSEDLLAPPSMTKAFFDAGSSQAHRGYVNKANAGHLEPIFWGNELLGTYTAAWFKLYLDGTPQANGIDYHSLIYDSLCGGGDGKMTDCQIY